MSNVVIPDGREIYISVDIEADGPIPGDYSMVSLGAKVIGYGAAYHPSNRAFLEATNTDHEAALSRYTAVVHLESIAVANPSLYSRGNNPYRYEDLDEAISLEAATRRAWLDHPQHVVIEGDDLTHKTQTVLQLIQEVLDNDSL